MAIRNISPIPKRWLPKKAKKEENKNKEAKLRKETKEAKEN